MCGGRRGALQKFLVCRNQRYWQLLCDWAPKKERPLEGNGSALAPWWPCTHPHTSHRQRVEAQPESQAMLCDPPGA